jgi:protoheme IX farnesyltransferase
MFLIIFLWTPPHFWALAIRYADDYRLADVPMLPAVVGSQKAAGPILRYTIALVAASLLLTPVADLGAIYTAVAVVAGLGFIALAVRLRRIPTSASAMRLFTYSISYVTLLFAAMAVDVLVR